MDAERKLVDIGPLASEVEDPDLGIGDSAVESRLGKGLEKNQCVRLHRAQDLLTLFLQ